MTTYFEQSSRVLRMK